MGNAYSDYKASRAKARILEATEDADKVRIDPAALNCPICFSIFSSVPLILTCGHTFCRKCIQTMIQQALYDCPPMRTPEFECAICRSKISAQISQCKNYIVEDIINTISVPTGEVYSENEVIKGQEFLLNRMRQQLREAEENISILKNQYVHIKNRFMAVMGVIGAMGAVLIVKVLIY